MAVAGRVVKVELDEDTAAPKLRFTNENDIGSVFNSNENMGQLTLLGGVPLPKLLLSYPIVSILEISRNAVLLHPEYKKLLQANSTRLQKLDLSLKIQANVAGEALETLFNIAAKRGHFMTKDQQTEYVKSFEKALKIEHDYDPYERVLEVIKNAPTTDAQQIRERFMAAIRNNDAEMVKKTRTAYVKTIKIFRKFVLFSFIFYFKENQKKNKIKKIKVP